MKRWRTALLYACTAASATMHLWCASDDGRAEVGPDPDAALETGAPEDARASDADAVPSLPACSDALCRVSLPGIEDVGLNGLYARSASEVWVVGSKGFAARFDGAAWHRVATGTTAAIFGVAGSSDGTVWGASSGHAFLKLNRPSGGGVETVDGGFEGVANAISASGTELYAVGLSFTFGGPEDPPADNIWRYGAEPDGGPAGWRAVSPPCPMGEFGVECVNLRAVWVESSSRQWFAGDEGKVFHTDTTPEEPPSDRMRLVETNSSSLRRLNALWGFGANDIWAVGVQGAIRHWTGGDSWTVVPSPVTQDLYGVWGSRPDDVWAVGDDGIVLHWNGNAWSVKDVPFAVKNRPMLLAVAGTDDDVWIAGVGTLLRSTRGAARDD